MLRTGDPCSRCPEFVYIFRTRSRLTRSSAREKVPSLGILWARTHLTNEPTLHQSHEARARGAWRQTDHLGDLAGDATCAVTEDRKDGLLRLVERRFANVLEPQRHSESGADLLEGRWCKSGIATGRCHALNAAAPLLDQAQSVERATYDAVPQPRDPAR